MAEEPARKKSRNNYLSTQLEKVLGSDTIASPSGASAALEERRRAGPMKKDHLTGQQGGKITETLPDGRLSKDCARVLFGGGLAQAPAAQAARGPGRSGKKIAKGFAPGCTHRKAHVYFE
eukprot:gene3769-2629_t